ncbi:MAG: hypothetical protein ABIH37_02680 [archaeon]
MAEPFIVSSIFVDYLLPFVLVFVLIFAILQKTKLLGDDVKQINALVALVVGLILLAFPYPRGIIVMLMPFLAVFAIVLLVFMLLYGFIMGKKDGGEDFLHKGWKIFFAAILLIALVAYLIFIAGFWDFLFNALFGGSGSSFFWVNFLLIVIIIASLFAVLWGERKKSSSD